MKKSIKTMIIDTLLGMKSGVPYLVVSEWRVSNGQKFIFIIISHIFYVLDSIWKWKNWIWTKLLLYSRLWSTTLLSRFAEDSKKVANSSPLPIRNISLSFWNSPIRLYLCTIIDQTDCTLIGEHIKIESQHFTVKNKSVLKS